MDRLDTFLTGLGVSVRFDADESGWYRAELPVGEGSPVIVERWLADEEGIRAELNAWAAHLETCDHSPHHAPLMERCIQTRQLFVLRKPLDCGDDARMARVCQALCRELALLTDGFIQIDGEGVLDGDGTLLIQEY